MRRELYENQPIRTAWDEDNKEWYFAIFDVIAVLAESSNPQTCWRVIKKRLKNEGNETVTNCHGLKMKAAMEKKNDRYFQYGTALAYYSIHTIEESGAIRWP